MTFIFQVFKVEFVLKRGAMRIHAMDRQFCTIVVPQNVGSLIVVMQSVHKNVGFNLIVDLIE